jgi:hypothetical protein
MGKQKRRSRRCFVDFLLLVATLTAWTSASDQAVQKPFSISISAETPVVKAGSDVYINVHLTNTTNHNLDDSGSIDNRIGLDPNLLFAVRDTGGKLVPKRVYKHPELTTGTPVNRTVRPGESISLEQCVSRLYDMSRPGEYVIQVSRRLSDNPKDGLLKSNTTTVTVTP